MAVIQQDVSSLVNEVKEMTVHPDELCSEKRIDSPIELRRSQREKRPPSQLKDFVCKKHNVGCRVQMYNPNLIISVTCVPARGERDASCIFAVT